MIWVHAATFVFSLGVLTRGGWHGDSTINVLGSRILRRHYRSSRNAAAACHVLAQEANEDLRPRQNSEGEPDCKLRILGPSAYCEEHASYPVQKVKKILQNLNLSLGDGRPTGDKTGELSGSEYLCSYKVVVIRPKVAMSINKEWLFVVNGLGQDQLVTMELCRNPGEECTHLHAPLPHHYAPVCVQKTSSRWLLAVDPQGKGAFSERFEFPSCCVCRLVRRNRNRLHKRWWNGKWSGRLGVGMAAAHKPIELLRRHLNKYLTLHT